MSFKGIKRRIQKPAAAPEVPVAYQAAEVVRHWRETGEFSFPDGSRVSLALYREIIGTTTPASERNDGQQRPKHLPIC